MLQGYTAALAVACNYEQVNGATRATEVRATALDLNKFFGVARLQSISMPCTMCYRKLKPFMQILEDAVVSRLKRN